MNSASLMEALADAPPAADAPHALASVVASVSVLGIVLFAAGIAVGMLLVFSDRHGYERPVSAWLVAAMVVAGAALTGVATIAGVLFN